MTMPELEDAGLNASGGGGGGGPVDVGLNLTGDGTLGTPVKTVNENFLMGTGTADSTLLPFINNTPKDMLIVDGSTGTPSTTTHPALSVSRITEQNAVGGAGVVSLLGQKAGGTGGMEVLSVWARGTDAVVGDVSGIYSRVIADQSGPGSWFGGASAVQRWLNGNGTTSWEFDIDNQAFRLVTAASNTSPIGITTNFQHFMNTGDKVTISGVAGNTAANGDFTITKTGASTFTLDDSTGNGAYGGGGTVYFWADSEYLNGYNSSQGNLVVALGFAPHTGGIILDGVTSSFQTGIDIKGRSLTKGLGLHTHSLSDGLPRGVVSSQHTDDAFAGVFAARKSRGGEITPASVQDADHIGALIFSPFIDSAYEYTAEILAQVDGTVSSSACPTRLAFFTTPDASLSRAEVFALEANGDTTCAGPRVTLFHIEGSSGTPGIAAGPAAGSGPSVSVDGNDFAGTITITTGTSTGTNDVLATVTFDVAYTVTPRPSIVAVNAAAAALAGNAKIYVNQADTTTALFKIWAGAGGVGDGATYIFNYLIGA